MINEEPGFLASHNTENVYENSQNPFSLQTDTNSETKAYKVTSISGTENTEKFDDFAKEKKFFANKHHKSSRTECTATNKMFQELKEKNLEIAIFKENLEKEKNINNTEPCESNNHKLKVSFTKNEDMTLVESEKKGNLNLNSKNDTSEIGQKRTNFEEELKMKDWVITKLEKEKTDLAEENSRLKNMLQELANSINIPKEDFSMQTCLYSDDIDKNFKKISEFEKDIGKKNFLISQIKLENKVLKEEIDASKQNIYRSNISNSKSYSQEDNNNHLQSSNLTNQNSSSNVFKEKNKNQEKNQLNENNSSADGYMNKFMDNSRVIMSDRNESEIITEERNQDIKRTSNKENIKKDQNDIRNSKTFNKESLAGIGGLKDKFSNSYDLRGGDQYNNSWCSPNKKQTPVQINNQQQKRISKNIGKVSENIKKKSDMKGFLWDLSPKPVPTNYQMNTCFCKEL